jgi:Response regulator containing CheY-like receiver, AAA-type ATPase, and DNA-binding domains
MKILVVDDSVFSQQYTKKMIQKYYHADFLFANSGESGYTVFLSEKPDYVITDLLMPGINGQEMIGMIKKADENAKIIVLSSDIQKAVQEEVIKLGVLMFINKPLSDDKILALIKCIGG